MKESGNVRVIEGEEVRRNDLIEYFSMRVRSAFLVPEGMMAIEVPQDEDLSGGGKNGGRKGVNFAICHRRANGGSINITKREQELFSEILTPT